MAGAGLGAGWADVGADAAGGRGGGDDAESAAMAKVNIVPIGIEVCVARTSTKA